MLLKLFQLKPIQTTVHGFTLLELILVIVVISIMAVEVLPIMSTSTTISLLAQAKQLASDIRYTQTLAMTKGQRYYLIKQSSTTYQILSSAGTAVPLVMGNTTVTLNSRITFGTLTNLPNSLIEFDGRGTPYVTSASPGTALASTATIPLVSGGNTHTVSITPQTGEVSVS